MEANLLIQLLFLPVFGAALLLILPERIRFIKEALGLIVTLLNVIAAVFLFGKNFLLDFGTVGLGIDLTFRLYHFSAFIILSCAVFAFLITLYSVVFLYKNSISRYFFACFLVGLSFINAALLADNLIVLLFFWEGLLLGFFGMISLGNKNGFQTAIKTFVIIGAADLCMMAGIALVGRLSGTFQLSSISLSASSPLAVTAFVLLMIGAVSKAGAMPFHSWIPDAAIDSPMPFMAFFPGALDKLLGIYFLVRISVDMFKIQGGSALSVLMMIIGALTIIFAVMMALVQKDYKKLLSYHVVSQIGYMVLGVGTCLPIGIIGGIFHMLNNVLYKSCLFLTAGAVQRQAGTTNLEELGGLRSRMPWTCFCYVIAALSISGVPPFNGFFSKEMIYDAALQQGKIYYFLAVLGSFFTAASFLKLGGAAYMGKISQANKKVKEAPWPMLLPMIVIALGCLWFGLKHSIPLDHLIQPVGGSGAQIQVSSPHLDIKLVLITTVVLAAAAINHIFGAKIQGSNLKAVDYIHYAPGLRQIYALAEKGFFDPYRIGLMIVGALAKISFSVDRFVDWSTSDLFAGLSYKITAQIRRAHTGNYALYLSWSLAGMFLVTMYLLFR